MSDSSLFELLQNSKLDQHDFKKYKNRPFSKYNANGKAAIHYACNPIFNKHERLKFIKYLIKERRVNINQMTRSQYHPMHILLWKYYNPEIDMLEFGKELIDILYFFKQNGADFNVKDPQGISPLMICVKYIFDYRFFSNIWIKEPSYQKDGKLLFEYSNPFTYFLLLPVVFNNKQIDKYFYEIILKPLQESAKKIRDEYFKDVAKFERTQIGEAGEKYSTEKLKWKELVKIQEEIEKFKNLKIVEQQRFEKNKKSKLEFEIQKPKPIIRILVRPEKDLDDKKYKLTEHAINLNKKIDDDDNIHPPTTGEKFLESKSNIFLDAEEILYHDPNQVTYIYAYLPKTLKYTVEEYKELRVFKGGKKKKEDFRRLVSPIY